MSMLSGEQTAAAQSTAKHLAVVAGPGTGKTFTLAHRIAHHIEAGSPPHRMLALSFTNEACNALKQHLARIIGPSTASQVQVFTFHAFCRHLLQQNPHIAGVRHDFLVADEYDSATILKGSDLDLKKLQMKSRDNLDILPSYRRYLALLRNLNMVDYRSLLDYGLELCTQVDYSHIFVDEFQDTTRVQADILRGLVREGTQTSVFGDPNQAIYGFLNRNFSSFDNWDESMRPETCFLTTNFRSSRALVEYTGHHRWALPKQVASDPSTGEPPTLEACLAQDMREALVGCTRNFLGLYQPHQVAVLTYTNSQLAKVMDILKEAGIPFQGPLARALLEQPNAQAVFALLKYAASPKNIYLLRILDCTQRLMSTTIRDRLQRQTRDFELPLITKFDDNLKPTPKLGELKTFAQVVTEAVQSLNVAYDAAQVQQAIKVFLDEAPGLKNDHFTQRLVDQLGTLLEQQNSNLLPYLIERLNEIHECHAAINVRTIHSAKGMEFKAVIMPFVQDHIWQTGRNHENTLYVGITRAAHRLHLISVGPTRLKSPHITVQKETFPAQFAALTARFPKLFAPLVFKRL